jgi:hypothetical protein
MLQKRKQIDNLQRERLRGGHGCERSCRQCVYRALYCPGSALHCATRFSFCGLLDFASAFPRLFVRRDGLVLGERDEAP